ncbi:hypothetical protein CLAFUW4_13718 [Fulvia fulva]|uniref:Apple domain-containing protein n=1 Tax=Passalora fulva TaxID=5499 RepID=A0A9Q8UW46_PASFU|nr:uncharacterized protein CLAFUR5_13566 [Fulvia fulva]KAK4610076.1 hypothetical protein CLAFUR4_13721 [Fulvia fulva]KAK4611270.1 hypothetical protein CLAFUR0_13725 [Fulvia fulva]UJO24537.1 hypothetical protein CLAFUR5_13566 [Fulvia fulva]WPV22191.1 hypothetical protein CLAFUW4_13718 [Fulvia fulva]WPV37196.1 hypothetical protein CLAFUW7_13726 [Fulvia fulva]
MPPGSNGGMNDTGNYFIFCGISYSGEDIETLSSIASAEACIDRCSADNGCVAVAYDPSRASCLKKRSVTRNSDTPAPGLLFIFSLPYFTEMEHEGPPTTMPTPSPSSMPPTLDTSAQPTDPSSLPPPIYGSPTSSTAAPTGNFSIILPPLPDEPTLPWPTGPVSSPSLTSQTSSPSVYLRTTITGGLPATTVVGGSTRTYSTAGVLTTSISGGYTTTYTTGGVTQVLTEYSAPTATASSVADVVIGPCPAYNGRQYTDPVTGLTSLVSCATTYQGTEITTFYRSRLARLAKRATVEECAARCTIESNCVAYTSYASGQCTLFSEVTGQVASSEAAYSAAHIQPRVVDPGITSNPAASTSFEPLLPQLTVTATDISTLPGSTREVTITQDASSSTFTTTLVSVLPGSTIVSTDVITTTLAGSTVISTTDITTTLPASTSISTQVVATTAPASLIVSTYVSVPPAITVVSTMSAIMTTYVETITTQLPGSLIVSTEPATTVVSTVISTIPESTLTTTYSTTVAGSTILITTSLPGETTTAVFTTREVSTEVVISVITQEATTTVTYTPEASISLIETTLVSTFTTIIFETETATETATDTATETATDTATDTATATATQTATDTATQTIVATVTPSAYGLDAVPTCVSTGREYTAYDGSKFVMLCGLVTVGSVLDTVRTTSFSACVEICNQYGTSCAAGGWDSTNSLCRLYSFIYLDFAHAVSGLDEVFTDSAVRLSGPQGSASRSQVVINGGFDDELSRWTIDAPGRGSAEVVDGQAQIKVDNYRDAGPVVFSQAVSAAEGSAFLLELRVGASGFSPSSLTGLQGVEISITTADGSFLGYHELQLGEETALHYAAGTFPREVTELRLRASCFNCGPEVSILLDDIALYVYTPGRGGFGVTATLIPAASTITESLVIVETESIPVPTVIYSDVTTVVTATPTPSNYGFNGYNTVSSCSPEVNGQTYVAADESRFVMLCGHYIEGESLSSTPASSYSNCVERCNAELGCAGVAWDSVARMCQLYQTLVDAYAPGRGPRKNLQPSTLTDAAVRLTGPGGPSLREPLISNGGFDNGLESWSFSPQLGASVTVVEGVATLTYSADVNTITMVQQIQGSVGDGFVLSLSLGARGDFSNTVGLLPIAKIWAYLDDRLVGIFNTIQGDSATLVYAGGRLQTSARLLTVVAQIATGSGLSAILDDVALYTWKTDNSQNTLCTNDGQQYTSTIDGSQFIMLCNTGLRSGNVYRTVPAASYSQCVELCAQQGTICAGAQWRIDTQICTLYDRSGLQETGSPDVDYLNSAIRLTGPPSLGVPYTNKLKNGDFEGRVYTPEWSLESNGVGQLDVSANSRALVFSTGVGSGSRTINQDITGGTVGDVYLLTFKVSIPVDISYGSIELTAFLDSQPIGDINYVNSDITGSLRTTTVYASGTLMRTPSLFRLSVEFTTAEEAWISLDDIEYFTYARQDARAQTTIVYGTAYDFDSYAMATYEVPQVIAGQSFGIELRGLFLTIPDDRTSCTVTVYSDKTGVSARTILFTGRWNVHTVPTTPQRFDNYGLISGTTTAFDIEFMCDGTTGSTLSIASINFYVNTPLQNSRPSPVVQDASTTVPSSVPAGSEYRLTATVIPINLPADGYCNMYLAYDVTNPKGTVQTSMGSDGYLFQLEGTATSALSILTATYACYGSISYIPTTLQFTATAEFSLSPEAGSCEAYIGPTATYNGVSFDIRCGRCFGSLSAVESLRPTTFEACLQRCATTTGCVGIQLYDYEGLNENEPYCYVISQTYTYGQDGTYSNEYCHSAVII